MASVTRSPAVTVVAVTHNSADVLPGLVESLEAGMVGTTWELVVVDNASTDQSAELAGGLMPSATVVRSERNGGYAAGINLGVASARPADAILVVNPDVRLEPGCAATLAAALDDPAVGMAAPHLVDGSGDLVCSIRREPTLLRMLADALMGATRAGRIGSLGEVATDPGAYTRRQVVDWAEGSTLLIDMDCWRRVGSWDESFFLYSEETDYALRVRDAELCVVYVPEARAVHLKGGSAVSTSLWPLLATNRWRLYRKRHGTAAGAVFWAVLVLREGTRAALGRPVSRAAFRALLSPRRLRQEPGPEWIAAR